MGNAGRVNPTVAGGSYGAPRSYGQHSGIDDNNFRAGDGVGVAADGILTYARNTKGAGGVVAVDHGGGRQTVYKHLDGDTMSHLSEGQQVRRGDFLGTVATDGKAGTSAKGAHLHYEAGRAAGVSGKTGIPRTVGNPNAAAGTPERQGAIGIQHEAASKAARLHALSSVVSSVGSTVASQTQSAFTQFNRY